MDVFEQSQKFRRFVRCAVAAMVRPVKRSDLFQSRGCQGAIVLNAALEYNFLVMEG